MSVEFNPNNMDVIAANGTTETTSTQAATTEVVSEEQKALEAAKSDENAAVDVEFDETEETTEKKTIVVEYGSDISDIDTNEYDIEVVHASYGVPKTQEEKDAKAYSYADDIAGQAYTKLFEAETALKTANAVYTTALSDNTTLHQQWDNMSVIEKGASEINGKYTPWGVFGYESLAEKNRKI